MDRAVEQTARVLAQLGSKDQPSKGFQALIRLIGEAKTKHVSTLIVLVLLDLLLLDMLCYGSIIHKARAYILYMYYTWCTVH